MRKYVLGVDGGNTKTDYFLYDSEGLFVDAMRSGTCSHEALKDSYAGSFRVMKEDIEKILSRNQLSPHDIVASAFGLAGVDVPHQKASLEDVIRRIGFSHFVVANDGFLGIKAGTESGIGVCSINGTGTVSVGIDDRGHYIQVGGIGSISGDEAGGAFLARRVIQVAYDETYRYGQPTTLTKELIERMEIKNRQDFSNQVSLKFIGGKIDRTELVKMLFRHANDGDFIAQKILADAGEAMARSVAGCMSELEIDNTVEIVLAGSVWAKATAPHMFNSFCDWVERLSKRHCSYHILNQPPAIGAVIWALELANGKRPDQKMKAMILDSIEKFQETR